MTTLDKKILLLSSGRFPNWAGTEDLEPYLGYAPELIQKHYDVSPTNRKKVLFVAYASAASGRDNYFNMVKEAVEPLGIDIVAAHSSDNPVSLLDEVDGVYIGGGSTQVLLDELKTTGLDKAIKKKVEEGMPYAGESAGSNVAGIHIRTTNDNPIIDLESMDAMGIVPWTIKPHYMPRPLFYENDDGEFIEFRPHQDMKARRFFLEEGNDEPMLCLPEGAGLRRVGDQIEVIRTDGANNAKDNVHLKRKGLDDVEIEPGIYDYQKFVDFIHSADMPEQNAKLTNVSTPTTPEM